MKQDDGRNEDYVLQVRDTTHRYIEALIQENERLRGVVKNFEEQQRRSEQERGLAESEIDRIDAERRMLAQRIGEIESQSRDLRSQFAEIEQQNSDLASLYVASYRLHETIKRSEVIAVIEEIVVNMIGSEQLAIFERDADSGKLELLDALGIDADHLDRVRLRGLRIEDAADVLQEIVESGERYWVSADAGVAVEEGSELTACVPLVLDGRVTGAIAVLRLLDQKQSRLDPIDLELFDLLATHAAAALYCSDRASDR